MNQLQIIQDDIYSVEKQFNELSAFGSSVKNAFAREASYALQILEANNYALKLAVGARQSVINAVLNIAAIGLSLNPSEKEAYLVPRNGQICLDISYMGLMRLATDTGSVQWVQADIVYAADEFIINGLDKQPTHKYNAFSKDRGEPVGVYVTAKLANGDYLTGTMTTEEVNAIRDSSQGYIAYVSKKAKSSVWVDHWGEMAKKTIVKRECKYWPKSERMNTAINVLNTDSGEGIHHNAPAVDSIAKWRDAADKAGSKDEMRKVWQSAAADFKALGDVAGWDAVKEYLIERIADFDEVVS